MSRIKSEILDSDKLEGKERRILKAEYCTSLRLPEYSDNPLISALGPIFSDRQLLAKLRNMIPFSPAEREWLPEERIEAVGRLTNLGVTRYCVSSLASTTYALIRRHYANRRSPLEGYRSTAGAYYSLVKGKLTPIYELGKSHSGCLGVYGISGIGKTTAVLMSLRYVPEAIEHEKHGFVQIVWVRVQCSKGAVLKDSLLQILTQIDDLVDTRYAKEMGSNATIPELCNKLARVAHRHYIGLIWIDEIQNAFLAAERSDPYLDFFVNFTNVGGVPFLLTGTPTFQKPGKKSLRFLRRTCSAGRFDWEPFSSVEMDSVFRVIQELQWLEKPTPLCEDQRAVLTDLTQGIAGILIPLYQLSQIAAIRSGLEQLSSDLFRDVADRMLAPVQPIMKAMKQRDMAVLTQYNDVLSDTVERLAEQVKQEISSNIYRKRVEEETASEARMFAVGRLLHLKIDQDKAFELVTLAGKDAPWKSVDQLTHDAAALYFGATVPSRRPKKGEFPVSLIE